MVLAAVMGFIGLRYMGEINQRLENMYTQELVTIEALDDAKSGMYRIRGDSLEHVLADTDASMQKLASEINDQQQRIGERLAQYRNTRLAPVEKALVDAFEKHFLTYIGRVEKEILPLSTSGRKAEAEALARGAAVEDFRKARVAMNELMDYSLKRAGIRYGNAITDYRTAFWAVIAILAIILAHGALISYYMTRAIVRPLKQVFGHLGQIAEGNLDSTIETHGRGEIGQVLHAMADAQTKLAATINQRRQAEAEVHMQQLESANKALSREKEHLRVTLESIGDAVITTDVLGMVEYLNPVAETMTGWSSAEACGLPLSRVFSIINETIRTPADNPVAHCLREGGVVGLANHTLLIDREGKEYSIDDTAAPIRHRDGHVIGAILVFHDTTDKRRLAKQISWQATHDALTGLVNRLEFERQLGQLLGTARHENRHHVLCYLDLDQFKIINDTAGHVAGDSLLRDLAALIQGYIRDTDMLARLGGDEFGILLENCSPEKAKGIASNILGAINTFRFAWQGRSFNLGASIGLVPVTPESKGTADLLSAADTACYVAKDRGRNRFHVYLSNDTDVTRRQGEMEWVARIEQAITENRFRLYYQPIAPLVDQSAAEIGKHCELLLRLVDDRDGMLIAPDHFIPAAERYRLMPQIDRWMLQTAFGQLHECAGLRPRLCSINLSGQSLGDEAFIEFVMSLFRNSDVPPQSICFEITETAAIANLSGAQRFISVFREKGCHFALDDFGSGLSSFAYLQNLPVEYLKIDGVFVKNVAHSIVDRAMVAAIHQMACIMGMETIAECVEDTDALATLREIGVNYVQGYVIARPQPLEILLGE